MKMTVSAPVRLRPNPPTTKVRAIHGRYHTACCKQEAIDGRIFVKLLDHGDSLWCRRLTVHSEICNFRHMGFKQLVLNDI